ncbi:MAG: NAD-binding protein [Paracoccaceae bacterium]
MPSWLWLILSFVGVSVLALFGLKGEATWAAFLARPELVDNLYGVVQLFVVEGRILQAQSAPVPWQLYAAAFAAPAVTVFAFLQLVWRDVANGFSALLHRWVHRGHVVVIGLGRCGRSFATDALKHGQRVVAVDVKAKTSAQIHDRFNKFRFVEGDVFSLDLATRCGARRAQAIVVFCGDDFRNITIARHVSDSLGARGSAPDRWPRIICHAVASPQREQAMADQEFRDRPGPQIEFYSPEEVAARQLITRFRPARFARLFRRSRVHPVVFGDTPLAEAVIRQVAVLCQDDGETRPEVSVVAPGCTGEGSPLAALAQRLAPVCRLRPIAADPAGDAFWTDRFPALAAEATQHVVCLADPREAADLALRLRRETEGIANANTPVFLGPAGDRSITADDPGPARKRSRRLRPFASNLITAFGQHPNVLSWRSVIDQDQDRLARHNHRSYLAQLARSDDGANPIAKPAGRPWEQLSETYRYSNRSFVDHIPEKLALAGYAVGGHRSNPDLDDAEIAKLARAEHNRWIAERTVLGWTYGPERDDRLRKHPDLVGWADLPETTQAYDKALVRALPDLLSGIGESMARVCRIGVSGHRDPAIALSNKDVVAQIERVMRDLRDRYPGHLFEIWSPLAEGADRLVAELAMRRLDARLHVPLPLPLDRYRDDFVHRDGPDAATRTEASLRAFHSLLDRACLVVELPAQAAEDGSAIALRHRQYASVGAFLLQHCDEMIFVWDGAPAAGHGGTGQIVEWQKVGRVPDVYRWPGREALARAHVIPFARETAG